MILIIVNIFFYASFLDDLFPFFAIAIYIRHIHHPETSYLEALRHRRFYLRFLFFHPDYTVGFGIAPNHAPCARGLYRRSGISPCPEDFLFLYILALQKKEIKSYDFFNRKVYIQLFSF